MALTIAASTVVSVLALALVAGAAPDAIRDVPLLGELMSHRGWVGPSDVARNAPLPEEQDQEGRPADADAQVADQDRRRATDPDAPAGFAGPRLSGREDAAPARPPAGVPGGPVEPGRPVEPGSTPPRSTPDAEDPDTPPPAAELPGRGPIGAYITPSNRPDPNPSAHRPSTRPAPSEPDPKPDPKPSSKPSSKPAPGKPSSTAKPDDKPDDKPDKDDDKKPDKKDDHGPAGDAGEGSD